MSANEVAAHDKLIDFIVEKGHDASLLAGWRTQREPHTSSDAAILRPLLPHSCPPSARAPALRLPAWQAPCTPRLRVARAPSLRPLPTCAPEPPAHDLPPRSGPSEERQLREERGCVLLELPRIALSVEARGAQAVAAAGGAGRLFPGVAAVEGGAAQAAAQAAALHIGTVDLLSATRGDHPRQ